MAEPARARRAARPWLVACALAGVAVGPAGAEEPAPSGLEAPLAVRDQNPLLRPFYLPTARLAPQEGLVAALALDWHNTVNLPHTPTEQLYVDEETAELDLRASWRKGPWLAAIEVPFLWRGGGILDGVIDDWHGLLGVNRGYRPYVQSNAYRISYHANGQAPVTVARGPALGDLPLEAGRVLYSATGTELSLWTGATLPTGSREHATGSGAVDAAGWLSAGQALGPRLDVTLQAGAMRTGGPAEFARVARWVEFGTLGVGFRASGTVTLLAQADLHSALPPSELNFLRPPVVGSLAARVRMGADLALDAGFQEDLATNRSPDFTIYLQLRRLRASR